MQLVGRSSPNQKKSCDRCRQQKVKCLRGETQRSENDPSTSGRSSLFRCERCMKAGVDCVSSLTSNITKHRSNRRSVQSSVRRNTDPSPRNLEGMPWLGQALDGRFLEGDYGDFAGPIGTGPFPGLDGLGAGVGFNGWDGDASLPQFSPTSLDSLAALSAADAGPSISTAPSTPDGRDDSEDIDNEHDLTDALSSQLTSLSLRATRAKRRLVRPDRLPLTVSSPEVSEALETTNILIRIVNSIIAPDRDSSTLDPTATDYALAFSALACHQHLVGLFRAICDAILQCLQSKKELQQHQYQTLQQSDVGPSSIAQFVMVLQLLMHLINRIDRSLFQNNPLTWQGPGAFTSGNDNPLIANVANYHTINFIPSETEAKGSSSHGGLLTLVQEIVGTIPNEHEKLRQAIQKMQTDMEHSELHLEQA